MRVKHELMGKSFGNWVVLEEIKIKNKRGHYETRWLCECNCKHQTTKIQETASLIKGRSKSCGLCNSPFSTHIKTYGLGEDRIYSIHRNMIARCFNKNIDSYRDYGGRGIKICDKWLGEDGFITFYNWSMENGYQDNLTIERMDVNGNYEPSNCKWATNEEQCNNRRTSVNIEIKGKTQTAIQWAREYGFSEFTIYQRLKDGKTGSDLIKPLRPKVEKQSSEKGIRWRTVNNKWEASYWNGSKTKVIGCFITEQEAIDARKSYIENYKNKI